MRSAVGFFLFFLISLSAPAFAQHARLAPTKPARNREFQVPEALRPRVNFWKLVFAKYGKNQVILHHRRYPQTIFAVLDFSRESESLGPMALDIVKEKETKRKISEIKEALRFLSHGRSAQTHLESTIEQQMAFIPGGWTKYRAALDEDLVRSQTGIREKMIDAIQRSGRYLPIMEKIFVKDYGLPVELTRLPFVESSFNYQAYSSVGAAGIWQFMPRTARTYMTVNTLVDERRDPVESTQAAARYMVSAYSRLGTWPLAVTSYNHGMAGVAAKARKAGTTDIVKMIEGRECAFGFASSNFWPSFLAALEVYEERESLFPGIEPEQGLRIAKMRLPRPIRIGHLANQLGVNLDALRSVNYALSERIWEGKAPIPAGYVVKVPQELGVKLASVSIPEPVLPTPVPGSSAVYGGQVYRIRSGDTLFAIARRFGVSVDELKSINRLGSKPIKPGQSLVVKKPSVKIAPAKFDRKTTSVSKTSKVARFHKIKAGDTLSSVAKKNGTTVTKLKSLNKLRTDALRIGQTLKLE